ncbi:MAG: thiamine pyrophosphate-dependent enzyme, partial [Firmicutes bacterium]|nr:thiamine pyrophosphate-dependent enzyme [Bacillota bacterium]
MLQELEEYLVRESLPVFWCPGCGNGIILGAILRAFKALGLPREKTVVVTGIGCWGKADDYLKTNALHTTHGRALAYATGIKAARPELTVVALMGDGDAATIGGNHLIHAARRNIGVTAIVSNNFNYG